MSKRIMMGMVAVLVAACTFTGVAFADELVATQAAAANTGARMDALTPGNTYAEYDVTGDGVADTVKLSWTDAKTTTYSGRYSYTTRYGLAMDVNGERALTLGKDDFNEEEDGCTLSLVSLANGKKYLWVVNKYTDSCNQLDSLYEYSGGTFEPAYDLHKLMDSKAMKSYVSYGLRSPRIESVSGNSMKLWCIVTQSVYGCGNFHVKLTYKDGKLVVSPRTSKLSVSYANGKKSLKARRNITVYENPTGAKKAFTIKKGSSVKITKVYVKDRASRLYVKSGGKTGWMKYSSTIFSPSYKNGDYTSLYNKYFANITVAG